MARLARVAPVGVPQHIIQRGNDRQACFDGEEGRKGYLNWLKEMSKRHKVDVHAWVLMTNHVHILCTPQEEAAVSRMMHLSGLCMFGIIIILTKDPVHFGKGVISLVWY